MCFRIRSISAALRSCEDVGEPSGRSELAEDANYRDAVKKPPAAVNVGDITAFHEGFIKLGGH